MKIGYARVSSTGQNETAQVELLTKNGAERIFVDKASGTNRTNRPKLAEALAFVREGDTLIVTRLDRLARSVPDLHAIAKELHAKNVDLIATEQKIDTTTPTGRLMFNMLGAIAEFENDLRRERQAEGIAKAKAEGRYSGRPRSINTNIILEAKRAGERTSHIAERMKISRSSVYRCLSDNAGMSANDL